MTLVGAAASAGGADVAWDADARILRLRLAGGPPVAAGEREAFRVQLREWVGRDGYRVLADCSRLSSSALGWRVFLTEIFRQSPGHVRVAAYGFSPSLLFFLGLVKDPFPLDARAFGNEADARAWLDA